MRKLRLPDTTRQAYGSRSEWLMKQDGHSHLCLPGRVVFSPYQAAALSVIHGRELISFLTFAEDVLGTVHVDQSFILHVLII